MIGESVLKAWNARPIVASVTIQADGSKAKVEHSEHTAVQGLTASPTGVKWQETDDALPLPFAQWKDMWGGGATVGLVIKSSDLAEALNQEPLKVTGLHSGVYSVRVDGSSLGTFTNDQLQSGINLGLYKTPMSDQAMTVYQFTQQHGDLYYDRWRHVTGALRQHAHGCRCDQLAGRARSLCRRAAACSRDPQAARVRSHAGEVADACTRVASGACRSEYRCVRHPVNDAGTRQAHLSTVDRAR